MCVLCWFCFGSRLVTCCGKSWATISQCKLVLEVQSLNIASYLKTSLKYSLHNTQVNDQTFLQRLNFCFDTFIAKFVMVDKSWEAYMGQIPQDGNFGQNVALF